MVVGADGAGSTLPSPGMVEAVSETLRSRVLEARAIKERIRKPSETKRETMAKK
jgi:hypothetical protein